VDPSTAHGCDENALFEALYASGGRVSKQSFAVVGEQPTRLSVGSEKDSFKITFSSSDDIRVGW